jgi:hypothetical protein
MLLPLRLQSVHDSCATNTLCWQREMSENENLLHGPSNNILNIVLIRLSKKDRFFKKFNSNDLFKSKKFSRPNPTRIL